MTSGVYIIRNNINNKAYVGSSVNIDNRLKVHLVDLLQQKHHNVHLQRAFTKYGEDAFTFTYLIVCSECMSRYYEQEYIRKHFDSLYNISQSVISINEEDRSRIANRVKVWYCQLTARERSAMCYPTKTLQEKLEDRRIAELDAKHKRSAIMKRSWKNGMKHFKHKRLSIEQLRELDNMYDNGEYVAKIARTFSVSRGVIYNIVHRKFRYTNLPYPIPQNCDWSY